MHKIHGLAAESIIYSLLEFGRLSWTDLEGRAFDTLRENPLFVRKTRAVHGHAGEDADGPPLDEVRVEATPAWRVRWVYS